MQTVSKGESEIQAVWIELEISVKLEILDWSQHIFQPI